MALLKAPAKAEDGSLPKRIPVLPAGDLIKGEDGRAWTARDRKSVLERLNRPGNKLVLDENHSSIRKAPKGGPSPALAFLSDFVEDEDGVMYANSVEWTPYGQTSALNYGGISPVLLHRPGNAIIGDTKVLGEVTNLHSVALCNDPNLELPALNDKEFSVSEENSMDPQKLAELINTAVAAAVAPLAAKLEALETPAPNSQQAAPEAELAVAVNSALEGYISAGKIKNTEEDRADFIALASDKDKLAALKRRYDAAQPLVTSEVLELNDKQSPKGPQLGAQAMKLAQTMGWDLNHDSFKR